MYALWPLQYIRNVEWLMDSVRKLLHFDSYVWMMTGVLNKTMNYMMHMVTLVYSNESN